MKKFAITLIIIASSVSAFASVGTDNSTLYLHTFRSPSAGLEYRVGDLGIHAGLYSTILDSRGKSTEFLKVGANYYYTLSSDKRFERFESFVSASYLRGNNRDYRDKDAFFFESGFLYKLGKGFEVRLGTGALFAKGFKPELNPTVGLSYGFKLK